MVDDLKNLHQELHCNELNKKDTSIKNQHS